MTLGRPAMRRDISRTLIFTMLGALVCASACHRDASARNPIDAARGRRCISDLRFVDQDNRSIDLSSLKGKPVLVDFIYTSCPGPCEMITSRMAQVARDLDGGLGRVAYFVSFTIDPAHDRPEQLKRYSGALDADRPGWFFLTGTSVDLERAMAPFGLQRKVSADGDPDHVLAFFLLDREGREVYRYDATRIEARVVAAAIRKLASSSSSP